MDINNMGVGKVTARIAGIQQRFGMKPLENMKSADSFESVLNESVKEKGRGTASGTGAKGKFAADDIKRMVQFAAQKYGVDEKLALAVAKTESGFNADAVSSAGAEGVMQLMPETAKSLGVQNSMDPRDNVDGGVRYLKKMLDQFDGDTRKAIAAYNAGPGTVSRFNGVPPYQETREYVDKVLKACNEG